MARPTQPQCISVSSVLLVQPVFFAGTRRDLILLSGVEHQHGYLSRSLFEDPPVLLGFLLCSASVLGVELVQPPLIPPLTPPAQQPAVLVAPADQSHGADNLDVGHPVLYCCLATPGLCPGVGGVKTG